MSPIGDKVASLNVREPKVSRRQVGARQNHLAIGVTYVEAAGAGKFDVEAAVLCNDNIMLISCRKSIEKQLDIVEVA